MNMDRWKQGGDKYESIKVDEQWEKAHVEDKDVLEGIVDISEVEE